MDCSIVQYDVGDHFLANFLFHLGVMFYTDSAK